MVDGGGILGAPEGTLPAFGFTIPAVTGLTVSVQQTQTAPGVYTSQVLANVTAPTDTSFGVIFQISGDGGATWSNMVSNGTWSALSSAVAANATYEVQAAFTSSSVNFGAFCPPVSVTISNASLGPVAQALALGINQDFGLTSETVRLRDDWGPCFGSCHDYHRSWFCLGLNRLWP